MRIAMWSGPRNLSTALMRSFGARADTFVSDEPFYGAYLRETGDDQPMKAEVIASMDCDWASVARTMSGSIPGGAPIWYQKHMAHHMEGPVGIADLSGHAHAFLIRDPARVIASYAAKRVAVRADHLGLARQCEYFDREADRLGHAPPVVDAVDILRNPADVLGRLCVALRIAWDPAMLSWEPGRRATDGVWAAHWYGAVEASTGFGAPDDRVPSVPDEVLPVLDACRPHYDYLAGFRL
ncbi:sulfotransferase-like domain-containing protein [Glacieibacterium frigidum]|uniref:HAD family hydrolase n=1 Tax=Glacieibacterium frigidum TaxID=2593303 RepID=A0A552UHT8_9SPHN|nr:HAD family hydrolase [Glacieibacterium frigidum]TRW17788.1 HAD family hydrolase [Glacieibacterium frigidum]